jgi:hypothetical protein
MTIPTAEFSRAKATGALRALGLVVLVLCSGAAWAQDNLSPDCLRSLASDTALSDLAAKVALGTIDTQSFSMLTNRDIPSPHEQQLLAIWADKRDACLVHAADNWPEPLRVLAEAARREFRISALQLYDKKLTFGDFARRRAEIEDGYSAAYSSAQQRAQDEVHTQTLQAQKDAAANAAQACDSARKNVESLCRPPKAATPGTIVMPDYYANAQCNAAKKQVLQLCR